MIKGNKAPRPDSACHSADVLTPTERAAEQLPKGFAAPEQLVFRDRACKWGDDPKIRKLLMKVKGAQ